MRRMVVAGIVLACAAFIAGGGVEGQRQVGLEAAPARTATPVEVTNFPAVQVVSGAINVGNLPAVQAVAGSVAVTNLPLDGTGRLLVALPTIQVGSSALVLRSTTATYQGDLGGRTGATQKCRAEFPNSHFATVSEVQSAWNTRGIVWLSSDTDASWIDDANTAYACAYAAGLDWQATSKLDGSRIDGNLVRAKGADLFNPGPCSDHHPLLCAE